MNAPRQRDNIFVDAQSPVGIIVHCYHDRAQIEVDDNTRQPKLDDKGIPKAWYKVTIAWPKSLLDVEVDPVTGYAGLLPLRRLAYEAQMKKWPNSLEIDQRTGRPWFVLQPFLRDGDNPEHNTMRKDYLYGKVYLNFKAKAKPIIGPDGRHTGAYEGAPGLTGPYKEDLMPSDVYSGCEARVSCTLFGTEYSGKNFISVRLQNIQKSKDGERMVHAGRPEARSQFDALQTGTPPSATGGLSALPGLGGPPSPAQMHAQSGFGGQGAYAYSQGAAGLQQAYQQPSGQPMQSLGGQFAPQRDQYGNIINRTVPY